MTRNDPLYVDDEEPWMEAYPCTHALGSYNGRCIACDAAVPDSRVETVIVAAAIFVLGVVVGRLLL